MRPAAKLVMTVLGDYWFGADSPVPSAVLVAVLAEFGIGEDAARGLGVGVERRHRQQLFEGVAARLAGVVVAQHGARRFEGVIDFRCHHQVAKTCQLRRQAADRGGELEDLRIEHQASVAPWLLSLPPSS